MNEYTFEVNKIDYKIKRSVYKLKRQNTYQMTLPAFMLDLMGIKDPHEVWVSIQDDRHLILEIEGDSNVQQ